MKTKFYLLITFVFLTLAVSAQKYNVAYWSFWTNNNAWTDTLRTLNTYDANGHLIKMTAQAPNPQTMDWENYYIINYTLNSDATVQQMLSQAWDEETNTWVDATKTIFTYSASKKMLTQTNQLGFGGIWMDLVKSTYTYNVNDQLINQLDQVRNPLNMQWTNSEQINYTYNADGTENRQEYQSWDNQWVNTSRNTNTYDAAKKLTSILEERWQNQAWVNASNTIITYLANNSISETREQIWVNNSWIDSSRGQFSYNANGDETQVIYQEWNTTTSTWVNVGRERYEYFPTGIDPVERTETFWLVFPNPFVDQLTIESTLLGNYDIQLFNASGQLVQTFSSNESVKNLNLAALRKGAYVMKIKSSQNEKTLKLIKTR